MTRVIAEFNPAGPVALVCRPYRRWVDDNDVVHLPAPVTREGSGGLVTVRLDGGWVWVIHEDMPGGITRHVMVPHSESDVAYADLVDVDPDTLDPVTEPEAAWTVALGAVEDRVGVLETAGPGGPAGTKFTLVGEAPVEPGQSNDLALDLNSRKLYICLGEDQTGIPGFTWHPVTTLGPDLVGNVWQVGDGPPPAFGESRYLYFDRTSLGLYQFDVSPDGPHGPSSLIATLGGASTLPASQFEQTVPTTVWDIEHNLGFKPAGVRVVDAAGNTHHGDIEYLSDDMVRVSFPVALTGTVYLS